jgi:putative membrane protein
MIKFILRIAANAGAIYIANIVVDGFTFSGNLFILAGIGGAMAIFHTFVYPIVKILAFPLVLLTFGLFGFITNALLLWFTAYFVQDLTIDGFLPLLFSTFILSIGNTIFSLL